MARYLCAALVAVAVLWSPAAKAAHLETTTSTAAHDLFNEHLLESSSSTAHVEPLGGGDWQAKFKVELWSDRLNTSSTWVLVIDQQGCQITPLTPESQGATFSLPPMDGLVCEPSHASGAFSTVTE